MLKLNIEDYLFNYVEDENRALCKHVPDEFKRSYIEAYNSGKVKNRWDYDSAEDYANSWALEIMLDVYEDIFPWLIQNSPKHQVKFEFTKKQQDKWMRIWQKKNRWITNEKAECDIDHIAVAIEADSAEEFIEKLPDFALRVYWNIQILKELPAEDGMQPIWDLYIKYRKEAHALQDRIGNENYTDWYLNKIAPWMDEIKSCRISKYKNWPEDKPLPAGAEVIEGWVMPEDVAIFYPGDKNLFGTGIFYTISNSGWDLNNHCCVDL